MDKHVCMGIEYFNDEFKDIYDFLEQIFVKINTKVYTVDEIKLMSSKFEFDFFKAFTWIPYQQTKTKQISIINRLVKPNDTLDKDFKNNLLNVVGIYHPLTRTNIQTISFNLGFDVYNNCEFKNIKKIIYQTKEGDIVIYRP